MGKAYCLVVTDDYRRFSWVFFLSKKDETSGILKNFITGIENQLVHKVKIILCDNRTEFKNNDMNQFYGIKGIKREFINTISSSFTTVDLGRAKEQRNEYESLFDPLIPDLEDTADLQDTSIFGSAYDDEYVGAEADLSNLETNMSVSPIPTTRIHKDHPKAQIVTPPNLGCSGMLNIRGHYFID
ncbi:putative ribonuclease H-like domain-containing protein [Tanacetum coccineum]